MVHEQIVQLKKLKIDVVSELHAIRRKHAGSSSEEIDHVAASVRAGLNRRKK
jgi:hypothetical protein